MSRHGGFTLVELLIVIAIIAVLISILAPALQSAKEHATQAVCLGNQMAIGRGYLAYARDNNNWFPIGNIDSNYYNRWRSAKQNGRRFYPLWTNPPVKITPNGFGDFMGNHESQGQPRAPTLEERKEGCRTGAIYPYVGNVEAYHCPGDRRLYEGTYLNGQLSPEEYYHAYRSYQLPDGLEGQDDDPTPHVDSVHPKDAYRKLSSVSFPENKYSFLEDLNDLRDQNFSYDGWSFEPVIGLQQWWDTIGVAHVDGTTLSFLDGHANKYKWKDDRSVLHGENRSTTRKKTMIPPNPDIDWFVFHYPIESPYRSY